MLVVALLVALPVSGEGNDSDLQAEQVLQTAQPPLSSSAVDSDENFPLNVPTRVLTVRIPRWENSNSDHTTYVAELLRKALDRSKQPHERIELLVSGEVISQERKIAEIKRNRSLDVYWAMTSIEREAELLPIRIPIMRGLLGQRVFIIRADSQAKFSAIENLGQLSAYVAGQGAQWPDTDILRANGLPVVTAVQFESLFLMLTAKRFDYFPRGLYEAWSELESHQDKGMAVEDSILLSYTAPLYFFVNPQNVALAERIRVGLEAMIADGSFESFFLSSESVRLALARANYQNRKIFKLTNPYIPSATPVHDSRYWLLPP